MDPISSLSLFTNIMQVVGVAAKLSSIAYKLSQSPDGALAEYSAMEASSADLVESMKHLKSCHNINDGSLGRLADHTYSQAQQLLEDLGTTKTESGCNKWKLLKKAIHNVSMKGKLEQRQKDLGHLRDGITAHLTLYSVKQHGDIHDGIRLNNEQMQIMNVQIEELRKAVGSLESRQQNETQGKAVSGGLSSDNMENNTGAVESGPIYVAEASQKLLTDLPALPPMQSSSALGQTPTEAPVLFSPAHHDPCTGASCACACHLGQYYRTPLFLKRLCGALTFKGICRNHPAKPSEWKYWFPGWISRYNIYFWLERNVCGTPSFGLKFRRKVPWGGEDTIIRFALLGDTEGIKTILGSGRGSLEDVDPNHGRTPLHYAVQKNHVQTCRLLLQIGADRFIEDESGLSPTQKAWEHIFSNRGTSQDLDAFKVMFPNEDIECWQLSPLHKAVLGLEGLSLTEQLKPDVSLDSINTPDATGRTALHWGSLRGDLKAVELLLDAGADANAVDDFNCTPLLYAVSSATPRIVELLILRKADVNFTNKRGDTPLHYAARHKDDLESVKVLVHAGAQVDRKNRLGNTPFSGAAIEGRLSSGEFLLQKGADRHSTNKYGDTPLRETVHHNRHDFLQMLLQKGTRYDHVNISGSTILHAVALEGDTKTAQILRGFKLNGIDTQMRNDRGETAMDTCRRRTGAPERFTETFSELLASMDPVPQSGE